MDAIKFDNDKITVKITKEELGILGNALNEVCNGIKVKEFDTRIGVSINEAEEILESVGSIFLNLNWS